MHVPAGRAVRLLCVFIDNDNEPSVSGDLALRSNIILSTYIQLALLINLSHPCSSRTLFESNEPKTITLQGSNIIMNAFIINLLKNTIKAKITLGGHSIDIDKTINLTYWSPLDWCKRANSLEDSLCPKLNHDTVRDAIIFQEYQGLLSSPVIVPPPTVFQYFSNILSGLSHEELKHFVKYVTGNSTLSRRGKIRFRLKRKASIMGEECDLVNVSEIDRMNFYHIHTCDRRIDIAIGLRSMSLEQLQSNRILHTLFYP